MGQALTEQQIAAIQAGGTVAAAPAATTTVAPAAPAVTTTTEVVAAAPVAAPAAAPAAVSQDQIVAYLQGQVNAKDALLLTANVQLSALKEANEAMTAQLSGLSAIAAGSIRTMRVALKQAPTDLSAAKPEQILAEHASVTTAFESHFKPGGVAASAAVAAVEKTESAVAPEVSKQLAMATRFSNK